MSIDEAALRAAFAELRRRVDYLEKASGLFVDDAVLDRPKGDPRVKFVPTKWKGPDFNNRFFSQCSPEFLDFLADTLTWMANNPQEGKEQFAPVNRNQAAKARSWARRIRAREAAAHAPPPKPEPPPPAAAPTTTVDYDPATGEVFDQGRPATAPEDVFTDHDDPFQSSDDFSFPETDDEPGDFQFEESDRA